MTLTIALALASLFWSPPNVALRVCVPMPRALVEKVAVAEVGLVTVNVTLPRVVAPSKNVTQRRLAESPKTVAVNVTVCPTVIELGLAVKVIVVMSLTTFCVSVPAEEAALFVSPS